MEQLERNEVPMTWRGHSARAVRPEVGYSLLLVGQRAGDVEHLADFGRVRRGAKGRRRPGTELRSPAEVPCPPGAGERLERWQEGRRRRHPPAGAGRHFDLEVPV